MRTGARWANDAAPTRARAVLLGLACDEERLLLRTRKLPWGWLDPGAARIDSGLMELAINAGQAHASRGGHLALARLARHTWRTWQWCSGCVHSRGSCVLPACVRCSTGVNLHPTALCMFTPTPLQASNSVVVCRRALCHVGPGGCPVHRCKMLARA